MKKKAKIIKGRKTHVFLQKGSLTILFWNLSLHLSVYLPLPRPYDRF